MQEVRELEPSEIEQVSGGILNVLGPAVLIYATADILYDFGKGFRDGLNG